MASTYTQGKRQDKGPSRTVMGGEDARNLVDSAKGDSLSVPQRREAFAGKACRTTRGIRS